MTTGSSVVWLILPRSGSVVATTAQGAAPQAGMSRSHRDAPGDHVMHRAIMSGAQRSAPLGLGVPEELGLLRRPSGMLSGGVRDRQFTELVGGRGGHRTTTQTSTGAQIPGRSCVDFHLDSLHEHSVRHVLG
jgi:hypothetical protein